MITFNSILIHGHPDHVDLKMLEHAADIAKANRSEVKIIHVVDDYPKDASTWWNVRNPGKLSENIAREREDFLDGLVESLKKLDVENVSRELLWGNPRDEVKKEVFSGKHDLLMLVTTNGNRLAYGNHSHSSAADLISECTCPVWVAQKNVKRRVNRILACITGINGQTIWKTFRATCWTGAEINNRSDVVDGNVS